MIKNIKLPIELNSGETIFIDTNLNEEIIEIKKKIFLKTGIHILKQKLICCGFPLTDEHTLSYFGQSNPEVSFNIIPVEKISIFINLFTGKRISFSVKLTDNVETIKNLIFTSEGISTHLQKLFFESNELDNNTVIENTLITTYSTLDLVYKSENGIIIFLLNFYRKKIPFDFNPSETILNLKKIIQLKEGISYEKMDLFFGNKKLEDDKTLKDYSVKEGDIIYYKLKSKGGMNIFVKSPTGKTITFNVNSEDTVNYVKQLIQESEGFLPKDQYLVFKGKQLEGYKSLKDYEINEESTLHLVFKIGG